MPQYILFMIKMIKQVRTLVFVVPQNDVVEKHGL